MFCNIQPKDLQAIQDADDLSNIYSCITIHDGSSVVFVKTLVYHALGTLMPYPSEDPPRQTGISFRINGCLISVLKLCPFKVGGIHSIFQCRMAMQTKGYINHRKNRFKIAKVKSPAADVRKDFAHKTSLTLAEFWGQIFFFEDLKLKNRTASPEAKQDGRGRYTQSSAVAKAG